MGGKRKTEDKEDRIRRKIAKLEEKLQRKYNRRPVESSDEELCSKLYCLLSFYSLGNTYACMQKCYCFNKS